MGWSDWQYIEVEKNWREQIDNARSKIPYDAVKILVNDDQEACNGEMIEAYCMKYLGVKDGAGGDCCPTDVQVCVYYTPSFNVARDIIKASSDGEYIFDGLIQDIIDDKKNELVGSKNVVDMKYGVLMPSPAVMIVTHNHSYVEDMDNNRGKKWYVIPKEPDPEYRMTEYTKQIARFFEECKYIKNINGDVLLAEYKNIVGRNVMKKISDFLCLIDDEPGERIPVVVLGESGTGKEAVARLVHLHDRSETDPSFERFQPILMSAIGEGTKIGDLFGVDRLEPELEGQKVIPIQGQLKLAEHGTLFIDELGKMKKTDQAMFLRFLQDNTIRSIGGEAWYQVQDVRCVFATNVSLRDKYTQKELMLDDFLHRIDGLTIELPSLKNRGEDIGELIAYYVKKYQGQEKTGCSEPLSKKLESHLIELCKNGAFTGNIRQLRRFIMRLVLVSRPGKVIDMNDFDRAVEYSLCRPVTVS